MARRSKDTKAPGKPDPRPAEPPVEAGPAPARGRRAARLFLMVAGGLAAPCLALAAFFLTSSGGSDKPARPAAAQAGRVTGTSAPRTATTPAGPGATTTTTTAPGPVATPPRDPFAALVGGGPAPPGK